MAAGRKKTNMWPGWGNSGGSWPPDFPAPVAISSNTFNLNFYFKENTWRHYSAFSVQEFKSYENKYLPFDLGILKIITTLKLS